MTWNRPIAPEEERASGLPQDSICITVAARLTSTPFAAAQRLMLAPQNWISGVNSVDSVPSLFTTGMGSRRVSTEAGAGALVNPATNITSRALTHNTAMGGIKKPDRQPLPCAVWLLC